MERHSRRALAEARSIDASFRIEGYSLTAKRMKRVADIIDGRKDAGRVIRGLKSFVARRVRDGR